MTAPLTPPDCDLRGLQYMPLDIGRLMDSDLFALSTGEEFKAAVALWARSWSQVPAASLSADERVLARLTCLSLANWRKVSEQALRGWQECSDGRLYHPVVAEKALTAWLERISHRRRSAAGNSKRYGREIAVDEFKQATEAALACLKRIAPSVATAYGGLPQRAETPPSRSESTPLEAPSRRQKGSEEKRREVLPVGASSPPSPAQEAWQRGTVLLVRQGRMKEAKARTFLGGLLKENKLEPADMLPTIVNAQLKGTEDPQGYLTAAARALADRRGTSPGSVRSPAPDSWGDAEWSTAVRLWRVDQSWSPNMGPEPGEPGCRVPMHLMVEAVA